MAVRNHTEGSGVQGRKRPCKTSLRPAKTRAGQKKKITAMVPARFFSGTPEYAKGVVGRWGKMISFEDHPFFLV